MLSIREFRVENLVGRVIKGIKDVDIISLKKSRQCGISVIFRRSILVSPPIKHLYLVLDTVSRMFENSFLNVLKASICLWGGLYMFPTIKLLPV